MPLPSRTQTTNHADDKLGAGLLIRDSRAEQKKVKLGD